MSSHASTAQRGRVSHLRLRVEVARRRTRLAAVLAEGTDPGGNPALALRAHQLTELSTRRALANTLQNLLDSAEEPPATWGRDGSRPPLQREAVLAAREQLLALAERLREPGQVSPQAAALSSQLVWDSASPIYAAGTDATPTEFAYTILRLLTPRRDVTA